MKNELEKLESFLAEGKFGNPEPIIFNTEVLYEGIAELISLNLNYETHHFLNSKNTFFQIILRASLDDIIYSLQTKDVVNAEKHLRHLEDFFQFSLKETNSSILENKLISNNQSSSLLKEIESRLAQSMMKDGFRNGVKIVDLNPDKELILKKAFKFLNTYFPCLYNSSFSFIKAFAIVESDFGSAYNKRTPLMFVLNNDLIQDSIITAEFLIHESLHQKLNDIQLTRRLMPDSYDDLKSEEEKDVLIPWGAELNKKRPFSISRTFATYHVYIHLLLFYAKIICLKSYESDFTNLSKQKINERFTRIYHRVKYLSEDLSRSQIQKAIESEALELKTWLDKVYKDISQMGYIHNIISSNKEIDYN